MKYYVSPNYKTAIILSLMLSFVVVQAIAANPQKTLNQYIADLQKSPNDNALREKIIRHVQTMKSAPGIPEVAERFMARGTAAVKNAKDPNDFKDAVTEFEKATLSAPWLASAYYNLGIAQDKAGIYADAIKSLKLYILATPNASDVKAVKNFIYEIEYKQEKAAKESSPAAIAEKKQKEEDARFIGSLNGVRFLEAGFPRGFENDGNPDYSFFEVRGKEIVRGAIRNGKIQWFPDHHAHIDGRNFKMPKYSWCNNSFTCDASGTIYDERIEVVQDQKPVYGGRLGAILNMQRIR